MDIKKLIRPNILSLEPYSTARDDFKGTADVFLDANESPFENGYNRYPDPRQKALKARLSQIRGIDVANIFVGNGSDEAIDLCYRIFCTPGADNAVAISPSYGMYSVCADVNDVRMKTVALNEDFSLPVERLLAACDSNTKLMFICSPNNPTAAAFPLEQIAEVAERFDGILVVDEAYADFSDKGSMLSLLGSHPNVIVLQTLSKAWGLAGLRLGLAFSSKEIIRYFDMVKYPYNISAADQTLALKVLEEPVDPKVTLTVKERERAAEALSKAPSVLKVYPSDANFLLVKVTDADRLYDALLAEGVIVRNRSRCELCEGCLRITIGTPEENDRMIKTVQSYE